MTGNPEFTSSLVGLVPINAPAVSDQSLERSRLPATNPAERGSDGSCSLACVVNLLRFVLFAAACLPIGSEEELTPGGDLELIFEQIGMDLIFYTPPPRDDGTSWALTVNRR